MTNKVCIIFILLIYVSEFSENILGQEKQLVHSYSIDYERFCIRGYFNKFELADFLKYKKDSAKSMIISLKFPRPRRTYIFYYTPTYTFPNLETLNAEYEGKLKVLLLNEKTNSLYTEQEQILGKEVKYDNNGNFEKIVENEIQIHSRGQIEWNKIIKNSQGVNVNYHCSYFALRNNDLSTIRKIQQKEMKDAKTDFHYVVYPDLIKNNPLSVTKWIQIDFKSLSIATPYGENKETIVYDLDEKKFYSKYQSGNFKTLNTIFTEPYIDRVAFYSKHYEAEGFGWTKMYGIHPTNSHIETIEISDQKPDEQTVDFIVKFDNSISSISNIIIDNNPIGLLNKMQNFSMAYESPGAKTLEVKIFLTY